MAKKKAARPKAKAKSKAKPKTTKRRAAPKPMSEEAMMAEWKKAMTPGEGHARLEPMVGNWRAKTTFTMAPGGATGRLAHFWDDEYNNPDQKHFTDNTGGRETRPKNAYVNFLIKT